MTANEAAERLLRDMFNAPRNGQSTSLEMHTLLTDALAAERRATVERIRERFVTQFCTCGGGKHRPSWSHIWDIWDILDEEAAR